MDKLAEYTKSIAALIAAFATSLLTVFGEGDVAKMLTVVIAVAGVLAVYQFPNSKPDELAVDEWTHLDDEPV